MESLNLSTQSWDSNDAICTNLWLKIAWILVNWRGFFYLILTWTVDNFVRKKSLNYKQNPEFIELCSLHWTDYLAFNFRYLSYLQLHSNITSETLMSNSIEFTPEKRKKTFSLPKSREQRPTNGGKFVYGNEDLSIELNVLTVFVFAICPICKLWFANSLKWIKRFTPKINIRNSPLSNIETNRLFKDIFVGLYPQCLW